MLIFSEQFRPAFAERHRLPATDLHLAHEEDPYADEQQHGEPVEQKYHVPGRIFLGFSRDLDFFLAQRLYQFRIIRRESSKTLAVFVFPLNIMALNGNLLHVTAIDRRSEEHTSELQSHLNLVC